MSQGETKIINLAALVLPEGLIKKIPPELIRRHQFIPVSRQGNVLTVAFAEIPHQTVIEEIEYITASKLKFVFAPKEDIANYIKQLYPVSPVETKEETSDGRVQSMIEKRSSCPWFKYLYPAVIAVLLVTIIVLFIRQRDEQIPTTTPSNNDIDKKKMEETISKLNTENIKLTVRVKELEELLQANQTKSQDLTKQVEEIKPLVEELKQCRLTIEAITKEIQVLKTPCIPLQTADKTVKTPSPIIDGRIDDEIWKHTISLQPFYLLGEGAKEATQRTEAYIAYDHNNIYFAFTCFDNKMSELTTNHKTRDAPVWLDDCIEIFIDTRGDGKEYFHFILNAANVQYDAKKMEMTWNAVWWSQVQVGADRWTGEIAIPFSTLELPAKSYPKNWRFNICRENHKIGELAAWSPCRAGFHEPEHFGIIAEETKGYLQPQKGTLR